MLSLRSLRWSQVGDGNARLNESLLSSCSGSVWKPRITEPRSRNFLADMGGQYDLAGANSRPTTKNYRSNPEYEMIRKESREPWGGEENRTDLTRQHLEMQAVFLQFFYKVLTLRSNFRFLRSTGGTDRMVRGKPPPSQVFDNAWHCRRAKGPSPSLTVSR